MDTPVIGFEYFHSGGAKMKEIIDLDHVNPGS
jgi:hypothetical protein